MSKILILQVLDKLISKNLWDACFGGSHSDALYSLQQSIDVEYILGGVSNSSILGDKTQTSQGSTDYWAAKLKYIPSITPGGPTTFAVEVLLASQPV